MKYEVYTKIEVTDDFNIFDFISTGKHGNILKRTVASIVDAYTKRFPDRWIIFKGSTAERTRLYRIAIGLNYKELSVRYEIWGNLNEEIVLFGKDVVIDGFVIRRKKS